MPASASLTGPEVRNFPTKTQLDAFAIARQHTIRKDLPGPTFLEGMLQGNGDVGVCAMVRPDALGIHIGKNDCWDIRVSGYKDEDILPFPELLELWHRASEEAKKQGHPGMVYLEETIPFLREYTQRADASYSRKWPRPWPCGTVWLNWDLQHITPLRYALDPSNGLFTLDLNCSEMDGSSRKVQLAAFVDWETGLASISTDGPVRLESIVYSPNVDGYQATAFDAGHHEERPDLLPLPETKVVAGSEFAEFSNFQTFLAIGPTDDLPSPPKSDLDRNYSLLGRVAGKWSVATARAQKDVSLAPEGAQILRLDVAVTTPRDVLLSKLEKGAGSNMAPLPIAQTHVYAADELDTASYARQMLDRQAAVNFNIRQQASEAQWRDYWLHSAVKIENPELERIWYLNSYFLACCLKVNKVAPGAFGNWSTGDIGTAWHGDYHLDYNCQQVYWGVFSSNHPDMHQPYIELCENLLAMSEKFARDKFQMPGACFPLSSYPVPSQVIPYPVPPWAYQISMTPWAVQSMWWHYLYTQDQDELRRVYPVLRSAAQFIAAYVKKGPDGRFHVIPTVSSENWGFTADFRLNKDCILDLALIQFLMDAVVNASTILGVNEAERSLWREIGQNLAPYPSAKGASGEVWLDVVDAPTDFIYNVPVTLAPVFPGEQVGIGSGDAYKVACRTAREVRLEGGNDLVYQPLIRARLGILDLDWFIREVRYCSLPNGVANDRVRQSGGRYAQSTDFDFMMQMGVWCENFALPAVLNECMMQSYSGTIRLFPNTTNLGPARFENLRAVGAFLISAEFDGQAVTECTLMSEKGCPVRIVTPWARRELRVIRMRDNRNEPAHAEGDVWVFETEAGESYKLTFPF
jgi:hypothetical protein